MIRCHRKKKLIEERIKLVSTVHKMFVVSFLLPFLWLEVLLAAAEAAAAVPEMVVAAAAAAVVVPTR